MQTYMGNIFSAELALVVRANRNERYRDAGAVGDGFLYGGRKEARKVPRLESSPNAAATLRRR